MWCVLGAQSAETGVHGGSRQGGAAGSWGGSMASTGWQQGAGLPILGMGDLVRVGDLVLEPYPVECHALGTAARQAFCQLGMQEMGQRFSQTMRKTLWSHDVWGLGGRVSNFDMHIYFGGVCDLVRATAC